MTFGPIRKADNADLDMSEELTIAKLDEESLYGPLPDVPTQDSFGRAYWFRIKRQSIRREKKGEGREEEEHKEEVDHKR